MIDCTDTVTYTPTHQRNVGRANFVFDLYGTSNLFSRRGGRVIANDCNATVDSATSRPDIQVFPADFCFPGLQRWTLIERNIEAGINTEVLECAVQMAEDRDVVTAWCAGRGSRCRWDWGLGIGCRR